MVGPYDNAAADGRVTAVGFLFNSVKVPNPREHRARTSLTPSSCMRSSRSEQAAVHHGAGALDTAGRGDLPLVHFAPVTP
jgi:hypothetical protein